MTPCPGCGEALPQGAAAPPLACERCGADLSPLAVGSALARAELAQAQLLLRRGLYLSALSHLQGAARLCPLPPEGRLLLGLALCGAGRPRAALPYLRGTEAGERLGQGLDALLKAEARYGAARARALAGDLPGAQELLAEGPATPDGLLLFGLCALFRDDRDGARQCFERALLVDASNLHAAALLRL